MRLKTCGPTKWLFGTASWILMIVASTPPTARKTIPYRTYRIPSFLWSTVVTQSCSVSRMRTRASRETDATGVRGMLSEDTAPRLLQGQEVRQEGVELPVVELHRRHQHAGLQRARVAHPGA